MILQVELYWICFAIIQVLQPQFFSQKQLELLAKRQSILVERMSKIATDIYCRSIEDLKRLRSSTSMEVMFVTQRKEHSAYLLNLCAALKVLTDRELMLAYAQDDPEIQTKCAQLSNDISDLVCNIEFLGWSTPLNFMLGVDCKGRFVSSPNEQDWQLYPDMAWGCNDTVSTSWIASTVKRFTGEEQCHYLHPIALLPKLNIPNYFLWACILPVTEDSEECLDIVHNIIVSLTALLTNDDASAEDNSPFPSAEVWGRVGKVLPPTLELPGMPRKQHESFHDVLASKEATANLQLWLMQLLY